MKKALVLLWAVLILSTGVSAVEVAAPSALLMEKETGTVLFAKDEHAKLEPASVTKVMTILLTMEAIDSGALSYDTMITASAHACSMGGSQIWLKENEQMSVSDLLKAVCVVSANDCAVALGEAISGSEDAFVERMNQRAKELGMNDTTFKNATGLPADGHVSSAYDIALMSRELMLRHPTITKFTTIWMDTVRDGAFGLSNTNKLVRFYPGATGLKTGFTSNAGYCLSATAQRDGLGLIAVVMGAKTSQERFAGCKNMLDYGFANYALIKPRLSADNPIPVKLGTKDFVNAIPAEDIKLLLDKSQKEQVTTEITLDEAATAPVSKGQKLGTLTVRAGEQVLAQVPMIASEAIPALSWWQLFLQVLQQLSMSKPTN